MKKFFRNRAIAWCGGVCAGIASYFGIDVTVVRILTVVLSCFTGIVPFAYLITWLIAPAE